MANLCDAFYTLIKTFDREGQRFTTCPYRYGDIYFPDNKPEEKVRLALLHYLSSLNATLFAVKVEEERLDISIINKTIGNLIDYIQPAMIIETKREEQSLIQHKQQLTDYMKKKKTLCGLPFNCCEAFFLEIQNDGSESVKQLNSISEIFTSIEYAVNKQRNDLAGEIVEFNNATQGVFNDFKVLAERHRRNKKIKFIYRMKEKEIDVEGNLFNFKDDIVSFVHCGYDTKIDKKPFFTKKDFVRLVKIYR